MKGRVEVERIYGKNIATGKPAGTPVCRVRLDGHVVGYYCMLAKSVGFIDPSLLSDEIEEISREVSLTMDSEVATSNVAPISKQNQKTDEENEDYGDF